MKLGDGDAVGECWGWLLTPGAEMYVNDGELGVINGEDKWIDKAWISDQYQVPPRCHSTAY